MKYIVKNCPSILPMTKLCDSESMFNCGTYCKDCTDCVIKQVIDECKWETNIDINDRGDLAERILSSFDIVEINK